MSTTRNRIHLIALALVLFVILVLPAPTRADTEWGPCVATKNHWVHVVYVLRYDGYIGSHLMYWRSPDGGRTWETARDLYAGWSMYDADIAVSHNNVHIVAYETTFSALNQIVYLHSDDNGDTFADPQVLRGSNTLGGSRVAVTTDAVWVIFLQESPQDILLRRSFDNGETWDATQNLTSRYGSGLEYSACLAAGKHCGGSGSSTCIIWVEETAADNWTVYSSYSWNGGDPDTWTSRYAIWQGTSLDFTDVALAATAGPDFHATRGWNSAQDPYHRWMNPFSGLGWSSSTSIGTYGIRPAMDGSRAYPDYAVTAYQGNDAIYLTTGPGTAAAIPGDGWDFDVAAVDNGNIHLVWEEMAYINYWRTVPSRSFDWRGKSGNTDGLIHSDAQWGDLDGDGDDDLVICGYTDTSAARTITIRNHDGCLHLYTYASGNRGVYSTGSGCLALGDYDGDGDLDLAMAGTNHIDGELARVFRNDGSAVFDWSNPDQQLHGVSGASLAWGDYDRDGDLDLYLQGNDGTNRVAILYKNNPLGTLSPDLTQTLTGLAGGSADWADWDNDGDPDLLVTGGDGTNRRLIFYENNPVGTLTNIGTQGLNGYTLSDAAWGDFDNDGDLDLLITGDIDVGDQKTRIYRNDGTGALQEAYSPKNLYRSSCAWGDYNNDGNLDFALCGYDGGGLYTRVYRNTGDGFTHVSSFTGVREGSASWADVERDGNLDFFLTGADWDDYYAEQYAGLGGELNRPPTTPTGLACNPAFDVLRISWDPATDPETPSAGLYYCLQVGTTPGAHDVMSGTYSTPLMGNVGQATSAALHLPPGWYYWRVRSIDSGLMPSAWSAEEVSCVLGILGDLNCDCAIDNFDISPFVLALVNPADYATTYPDCNHMLADCNGDGSVDNFDISAFVDLLTGG